MKVYLAVTLAVLGAPVAAEPMWDIADQWRCTLERHTRLDAGGAHEMDPAGRSYDIDFADGTMSSAFISDRAKINQRAYMPAQGYTHTVLDAGYPAGDYPIVIQHVDGGFWQIGTSGSLSGGNDIWIAAYECKPLAPSG